MPRATWSGTVSFGMVSIPVELFPAVHEHDVHLHQIHKTCGSRIKYQKWCPVDECALRADEIEKGFEISKGHYVILTDEDFDALPVPTKHTIEVTAFVNVADVDPVYYESSYYVRPETAGKKPFALLAKVLDKKKVSALAKISLRQKESLCLLRWSGETLVLSTLYYPDEVRSSSDFDVKDVKVEEKELKMAESLVDLLSGPFEPEEYHDEYREALMQRIEAKAEGKKIQKQPEEREHAVTDIMEALRASLEEAQKRKKVAADA